MWREHITAKWTLFKSHTWIGMLKFSKFYFFEAYFSLTVKEDFALLQTSCSDLAVLEKSNFIEILNPFGFFFTVGTRMLWGNSVAVYAINQPIWAVTKACAQKSVKFLRFSLKNVKKACGKKSTKAERRGVRNHLFPFLLTRIYLRSRLICGHAEELYEYDPAALTDRDTVRCH